MNPPTQTMRPVLRGKQYAIAAMKPQAAQAAERVLLAGGNAFDACVAGQAVLSVTDAEMNGIGGDAVLLIYDARSRQVFSMNAEGTAPQLATIDWFNNHLGGTIPDGETLLTATVPGVVDSWCEILERWGTFSLEQLLSPAIELAEDGFPLGEHLAAAIPKYDKLHRNPSTERIYFPDGKTLRPGEIFRNQDLARTLKKLVSSERRTAAMGRSAGLRAARDRFYQGDIAREMGSFSEQNGGLLRYEDFAAYRVKVETPVSTEYRGYQIYKNASASQGPSELFALNILRAYDLKALGHNSAEYIHCCAEALKLAFADRDTFLGDMDFIDIPYQSLLSEAYAAERRNLIDPARASLEFRPGHPERFVADTQPIDHPLDVTIEGAASHLGDTSYICVVDREGNMVSFVPSLYSGFGTGVVMADLGFILNARASYYSLVKGHANALEPGKRPRSTLQSTLVMNNGQPAMVLGSPGGDDQCIRTLQTFLNIVEFGMNIQEAIEAPRWSTRSFPASPFPHTMYPGDLSVENRISLDVRAKLAARGHIVTVHDSWFLGKNAGIILDLATGVRAAGADPRVEAYALAW